MDNKNLIAKHKEVYQARRALAARFSLWSGKPFAYRPERNFQNELFFSIERVYRKGEEREPDGTLKITRDGKVQYFTFYSFSDENEIELNEARVYVRDCAELLSDEFIAKVVDDYKSKKRILKRWTDGKMKYKRRILNPKSKERMGSNKAPYSS